MPKKIPLNGLLELATVRSCGLGNGGVYIGFGTLRAMPQVTLVEPQSEGEHQNRARSATKSKPEEPTLAVVNGNSKLGQIWNFSLPWQVTCPGRSQFCEAYCYVRNRNLRPSVLHIHAQNYALSQQVDFAAQMIRILQNTQLQWKNGQSKMLRLHPAGDFYSPSYIEAWMQIATALPQWRFFGYTHSWNCELEPVLAEFRDLPNVRLYASVDGTTEPPPPSWKLQAWMSYDAPPNVPRCHQEIALKEQAFPLWKQETHQPFKCRIDPGRDILRAIAIRHQLGPLYCSDCGHCSEGRGSVWFKMRTKVNLTQWVPKKEA